MWKTEVYASRNIVLSNLMPHAHYALRMLLIFPPSRNDSSEFISAVNVESQQCKRPNLIANPELRELETLEEQAMNA